MNSAALLLNCLLWAQVPYPGLPGQLQPTAPPQLQAIDETDPLPPAEPPLKFKSADHLGSKGVPQSTPTAKSPDHDPNVITADQPAGGANAGSPGANDPGAPDDDSGTRLVAVDPPSKAKPAERILQQAFTAPLGSEMTGQKITMQTLLGSRDSLQSRDVELVRAYWRAGLAVAEYNFAVDQVARLAKDEAGSQGVGPALVAAAADALRYRSETQLAALKAQQALSTRWSDANGRGALLGSDERMLPVDRPLVSAYRTHYESIFAGRSQSAEVVRTAKNIHESLPLRYTLLRTAADAVVAAEDYQAAASVAFAKQSIDETTLLVAHTTLRAQRQAFLRSVLDYNLEIAEYAALAAPPGSQPAKLLPMLIKVRPLQSGPSIFQHGAPTTGQTNPPSTIFTVPPAASPIPLGNSAQTLPPQTGFDSSAVVRASAEEPVFNAPPASDASRFHDPRLRSVLVPKRR